MAFETGVVTGSEIKKNKDGKNDRRLLRVVVTDPEDTQTVEWFGQPGRDSGITKGDVVLIGMAGETKFAFAVDDQLAPDAADKEECWSSRDAGGAKAAEIILRTNADIELNGNDDFLISFNQLSIILGNLATALNVEFQAIAAQLPAYTPTPIVIDLTPARVDDVKIKDPNP